MQNDEKLNDINALEVLSGDVPAAPSTAIARVKAVGGRLVREAPRALPAEAAFDSLYSVRSQETYREGLKRALSCLNPDAAKAPEGWRQYPWHQLEYTDIAFIAGELAKRYRRATVAVTLSALRSVWKHAWKLGYVDWDTCERMRSVKTPRGSSLAAGRMLAGDEVAALRRWAGGLEGPQGALVRACFALMIGAGLRAEEICTAPVEAWGLDDAAGGVAGGAGAAGDVAGGVAGAVRVVGKGRKEREVPVGASETACLAAWLKARAELAADARRRPWLFLRLEGKKRYEPLNSQWLGRLCADAAKGAGLKPFTPHDCRRTFASACLDVMDLATVQRLMGHESPRTTARYDRRQASADAVARRKVTLW